ncbi:MAG: ABC transporter permease subunit [Christensenella sp.]
MWFVVFAYLPMGGLSLAFKTYHAREGIWGSPWTGLTNFVYLFRDPAFANSVWRTLAINIGKLVVTFPVPILLALMFNEVRAKRTSKILQTLYTFPNFLSWIITSGIIINVLSNTGLLNNILKLFGMGPLNILGSESAFIPLVYLSEIWKTSGWSAIVYIAAISGIDQEQYEAAEIDGASRVQKMFRITLPNIMPTIVVMFILASGNLMTSGFDQIFNLSNPATKNVAEVLDMYIYRVTFQGSTDFGYSTAVSLFRSVINMVLLLLADRGAKLFGGTGLFGEGGKKRVKASKKAIFKQK